MTNCTQSSFNGCASFALLALFVSLVAIILFECFTWQHDTGSIDFPFTPITPVTYRLFDSFAT